jgi:WS/DGAT/MGAT family acyltransferase
MDNLFLTLENERQYMHVAALGLYDPSSAEGGKVRFKTVLDFFSSKIHEVDFFRRRLVSAPFGMDRPYWIDDAHVDVEYHVRHIALPAPGDWRQLMIQVARIHARPLDLSRPLWEAYIIEGLDNIEGVAPGSFALYIKMHHSGVDGQSGAKLLQVLHSISPEYDPAPQSGLIYADRVPTDLELTVRGVLNRGKQLTSAGKLTFQLGKTAIDLGRKYGATLLENDRDSSSRQGAKTATSETRFDRELSPHRVVDALGLDMKDCNTIRRTIDATINDIFMATSAGGIRKYLQAHGELPEYTLNTMMPLAATGKQKNNNSANNVSMTVLPIHTDIEDSVERLLAIKASSAKGKEMQDDIGRDLVARLMDVIPSAASKKLSELAIMGNASVTISNVRGPEIPLYLAGARMQQFMPVSVPFDKMGLNVTGFSYAGTLWICLVSCREMVPDPDLLSQCLRDSFDELLEAATKAGGKTTTGKKPTAKKRTKTRTARRQTKDQAPARRR